MNADERLRELGLEIPEFPALPFRPKLVPMRVHAGLAYLSGDRADRPAAGSWAPT